MFKPSLCCGLALLWTLVTVGCDPCYQLTTEEECAVTPGCAWRAPQVCTPDTICTYPVPSDVDFEDNQNQQIDWIGAPCGATQTEEYWDVTPPDPVPQGGMAVDKGEWNYDSRKAFYGDGYTGTSGYFIGPAVFIGMDTLPAWGLTTNLSSEQTQAIASSCSTLAGWQQVICANRNCKAAEKVFDGVCRHISSCTNSVLRKMGWEADLLHFPFDLTNGHVVVKVKDGGVWWVVDPTWSAEAYWRK